ncbi:hypothetical protein [Micromonospora sp. NPDC005413]|uniref:hypothetical protein n=1 Tax=Micromonospora sp. NPDC005413 TaxID=3154563 RepID=UPI0033B906E4
MSPLTAAPGDRIDENGTGRTTLLRVLAGVDEPDSGSPRLCDELEEALGTGPGAIVVASHDRRLRSRWPGREVTLAMGPVPVS